MCGIVAVIGNEGKTESLGKDLSLLLSNLNHRGPDDQGEALIPSPDNQVSILGMSRLRIRSKEGTKIPFSLSKNIRVSFNGEIYKVDTPKGSYIPNGGEGECNAIVEAINSEHLNLDGMYSAVIASSNFTYLIRDKYGIKPIFITKQNGTTYVASEIKALSKIQSIELSPCKTSIAETLVFGVPFDGRTCFKEIFNFPPGSFKNLVKKSKNPSENISTFTKQKWHEKLVRQEKGIDLEEIVEERLLDSIANSVESTLISDHNVGLAYSGGLDSTLIAHILADKGYKNLQLYSIKTPDMKNSELSLSSAGLEYTIKKLGWKHHIVRADNCNLVNKISRGTSSFQQPNQMTSSFLYGKLAELVALKGTRVLITGEGVDELFGGYNSYLRFLSPPDNVNLFEKLSRFYVPKRHMPILNLLLDKRTLNIVFSKFQKIIDQLESVYSSEPSLKALLRLEEILSLEPLLRRTDHCLMAHGIEGRTPYLHGNVPNLARLALDNDLKTGQLNKMTLRKAALGRFKNSVFMSPKRSFRQPLELMFIAQNKENMVNIITDNREIVDSLGLNVDGIPQLSTLIENGSLDAFSFGTKLVSFITWYKSYFAK